MRDEPGDTLIAFQDLLGCHANNEILNFTHRAFMALGRRHPKPRVGFNIRLCNLRRGSQFESEVSRLRCPGHIHGYSCNHELLNALPRSSCRIKNHPHGDFQIGDGSGEGLERIVMVMTCSWYGKLMKIHDSASSTTTRAVCRTGLLPFAVNLLALRRPNQEKIT